MCRIQTQDRVATARIAPSCVSLFYRRYFMSSRPGQCANVGRSFQDPTPGVVIGKPLIFLSYHFEPSNEIGARRPTAFVRAIAADGVSVVVASAFGGIAGGTPVEESGAPIGFIHVARPRKWILKSLVRVKNRLGTLIQRRSAAGPVESADSEPTEFRSSIGASLFSVAIILDTCKLWSWRAASAVVARVRQNGACGVVASGPPMTNLVAGLWVSWRCRIPLVADFRDPWVIGRLAQQPVQAFDLWLRGKLERLIVMRADVIAVTTSELAAALLKSYPDIAGKLHVVRNGFDGELRPARSSTGNVLAILFAGEIYGNRNPFEFLEALERLLASADTDASRVTMTFVGQCATYRGRSLKEWMHGRKCDSVVSILPPVHASELSGLIERSTLLLNLTQQTPHGVPAKSYDHMASGREILILSEVGSPTAQLFGNISGVNLVDPADSAALDRMLGDLYQRHVVRGVATVPSEKQAMEFSRRRQSALFLRLVRGTILPDT